MLKPLSVAISQVLKKQQAPRAFRRGDLTAIADQAKSIFAALPPLIEQLAIPDSPRSRTAVALLVASISHGGAICALLGTENPSYGASAFALHRAQIEQFLRGAFFFEHASEEEVMYFLKNDKLKKREGKNVTLGMLAEMVQPTLIIGSPSKGFAQSVMDMWGPLCGFVHGGVNLLNMYTDANEIRPSLEAKRAMVLLRKALALAFIALVVTTRHGNKDAAEFAESFAQEFRKSVEINKAIDQFGEWDRF